MKNRIEITIEYFFYLMILLYLVGKSFEAITVVIDVCFLFYVICYKKSLSKFFKKYQKVIIAFAILLIYFLFQSAVATDYMYALRHSFGIIRFVILFFAILQVFNTQDKIKKVMLFAIIAVSVVSIDSIYQYIFAVDLFGYPLWGNWRLTAWTDRPIVSLYSGEFVGILLAAIFLLKGVYKKAAILSFILFILVFLLSGNRSPVVALFSTIVLIGLFSPYRKYLVYLLVCFSMIFSLTFLNDKLATGYSGIFNPTSNRAISGRKQVYATSLEMIKANPIQGIGGGMYRYEFQSYYKNIYDKSSKDFMENKWLTYSPTHAHNTVLDFLVCWGIMGLSLFVYLTYQIYLTFIRGRPVALVAAIGVCYCVTPLQFGKSLSQSDWQFYTFLGLIFLALISVYETNSETDLDRATTNN